MSDDSQSRTTDKAILAVDSDRFLKTCYRGACGLDGTRIVDFTGFSQAPPDSRRLFKVECEICKRKFVGVIVELSENAN